MFGRCWQNKSKGGQCARTDYRMPWNEEWRSAAHQTNNDWRPVPNQDRDWQQVREEMPDRPQFKTKSAVKNWHPKTSDVVCLYPLPTLGLKKGQLLESLVFFLWNLLSFVILWFYANTFTKSRRHSSEKTLLPCLGFVCWRTKILQGFLFGKDQGRLGTTSDRTPIACYARTG